ncbi:MAG: class I SAM-dependent methyltransferase [Opitutaceae bacterium]|nr:class I SAM-dependent methyltransferase [Opitutaceae bacterium]
MNEPSSNYRDTWNRLSETLDSALMHVAGYIDEERIAFEAERSLKLVRDTIGIRPEDTMLEIGCGVGRIGKVLAPKIRRWIGCDVSDNMLRHGATWLAGLGNVELVRINGHDLQPVPDASVDAVYCSVVFMHLEEWDRYAYVKEAFRVLRPGGRFYCDNANLDSDDGWAVFESSARFDPNNRPQHLSRCSTGTELNVYLRRAGFREVKTGTAGVWIFAWGQK